MRAGALELLECLLEGPSKLELLRALEEHALGASFEVETSLTDGLKPLFEVDDPWLRACAAWTASTAGVLLADVVRLGKEDPSSVVRAAATFSLFGRRPGQRGRKSVTA